MAAPLRLLLVQENHFYRRCLTQALTAAGHFAAVEVADDAAGALARAADSRPDVMLVDWDIPGKGALELTRQVADRYSEVKVLLFGLTEAGEDVRACAEAGGVGYVLKDDSFDELLVRIDQAGRGETGCSPRAARVLFTRLAELTRERDTSSAQAASVLTAREQEILRLIAEGLSNKEIAARLCLSLYTVKNHVHRILEKLDVPGRYAAVQYAWERRWLKR
jgi:two-component system, NarL family, nitrate/nitrite response regulator NarL